MRYTKITHGWVEQVFDDNGRMRGQEFVPAEGSPPERKLFVPGSSSHDEPLEEVYTPGELRELEMTEKHFPFDMVQPEKVNSEEK